MKIYEDPKMDIVNMAVEDIITTSPNNKDEGGAGDWE